MALRRNAPDKVKLKLRGDGAPLGDLGNDLLPQDQGPVKESAAEIRNEDGRVLLDWSGGAGSASLGHPDPAVAGRILRAAAEKLAEVDPDSYSRLEAVSDRLAAGLKELSASAPEGTSLEIDSAPGLLFFAIGPDPTVGSDPDVYARFRESVLKRGIRLPLSSQSPWSITLAHDAAAVDRTVLAVADALGESG